MATASPMPGTQLVVARLSGSTGLKCFLQVHAEVYLRRVALLYPFPVAKQI